MPAVRVVPAVDSSVSNSSGRARRTVRLRQVPRNTRGKSLSARNEHTAHVSIVDSEKVAAICKYCVLIITIHRRTPQAVLAASRATCRASPSATDHQTGRYVAASALVEFWTQQLNYSALVRYSSGEPGKPPCERCIREQHECVLGGSRRGGRRVKRSASDAANGTPGQVPNIDGVINRAVPHGLQPRSDHQDLNHRQHRLPSWASLNPELRTLPPLGHDSGTPTVKITVDDTVASTDLQNPADALEFLAHVAERDSGGNQLPPMHSAVYGRSLLTHPPGNDGSRPPAAPTPPHAIDFPPLNKGQLSLEMVQALLYRYEDKYHPFFPLANPAAMDPNNLPTIAKQEPHLLAAILTVASKDEKDWYQVHDICSSHMQSLVASLVYSGSGSVEAVEVRKPSFFRIDIEFSCDLSLPVSRRCLY